MNKQRITRIMGQRPTQTPDGDPIPAKALIFNAPRPLYGSPRIGEDGQPIPGPSGRLTWQGEFIAGIFYAGVMPDDPDRMLWIAHNARLDADRLEWVSLAQVRAAVASYFQSEMEMTPAEAERETQASNERYIWMMYRGYGLHSGEE